MKSPEYENYYDNNFHIFEELKMEIPDTAVPHSYCNVNNEIASEDKESSKCNDHNVIEHEAMDNRPSLNVTIKIERIEDEEILDNNKDMSVPNKLTVQDVPLNSDEGLLKNDLNLLKPNNKQTNTPRVVEQNELHKCKHCDKSFDHQDNMLIHMSLVHTEKAFKCELCGKELKKLSNLKRHITISHKHKKPPKIGEIIFKCTNCNAQFNNRLALNNHAKLCQKEEDKIAYKCDSCDGVYKSEQNLRNHAKVMHGNKEYKCKCCGAVFKMKQNLTIHMKSIHDDCGRTFDCSCGKQFRTAVNLRRHKRKLHRHKMHKINDRFQCDSCQKIFKKKRCLVMHIKRLHYDYGRMFKCWCGKQFRSPEHLCRHKRRQHKRKIKDTDNDIFQCDSCQKIFKQRQYLVVHIKMIHYDYGRMFDCWCGKRFRSPLHLYRHKLDQQHEGMIKDKFQCDNCKKIFKRKQSLAVHMVRVHDDYVKAFDCWCGKRFRSSVHLHRHKQQQQHKRKRMIDKDK